MSEPGDHVVREIPVFLSKCLSEKLLLVQYPQRPATVSMDGYNILQTKIKPLQTKIQMMIEMDVDSETYDPEHGKALAEAASGLGLDEDEYMPDRREKIDTTTMESTVVSKLTETSRYVIGVIRNGQVTFVPLKSMIQMKTVFPYLNKAEKARTKFQKAKAGDGESDEDTGEVEQVTLKFSRAVAAGKGPTRVTSYSARKKEEDEAWVDLTYDLDDPAEYEKLYSTDLESKEPFYVLNKESYLQKLFPKHLEIPIERAPIKNKEEAVDHKKMLPKISIQQMRLMTLQEQLRILFINAKLLQYHEIVNYLKSKLRAEIDETSLVKCIQMVAVLIQGCWVVKSDVIYPKEYKSSDHGISADIMQRSRDIILGQFTEDRIIERRKMVGLTRLPTEEVTEMLQHVSKMIPKIGWEFLLPFDASFVSRFPEVVQRQTLVWEMKKQHRNRSPSTSDSHSKPSGGGGAPAAPPRRRSRNISLSSDGDSAAEGDGHSRRKKSTDGGRRRRNSSRSENAGISPKVET